VAQNVVVVGCGVVGAAIAYTLSQNSQLNITVLDQQPPARGSTGAALGVLMGVISHKKGNALQMRLRSIQQYNEWVPQLEAATGQPILYNRQGLLNLCFEGEDLATWKTLATLREQQGHTLNLLSCAELSNRYPFLNLARVIGAVHAPGDRQVDPTALTLGLVEAARQRGVTFHWEAAVNDIQVAAGNGSGHAVRVKTSAQSFPCDWLVIAAGLGSTPLTQALQQGVEIRPVLGQAARVQLPEPLSLSNFPAISGEDTHLVPLGGNEYWVGATVEMPTEAVLPAASELAWKQVWQRAIAFCPALEQATILQQWSGLRPRPVGRPAPIIERLPGYDNVILASGHYRNGIALAPATAEKVQQMIEADALLSL